MAIGKGHSIRERVELRLVLHIRTLDGRLNATLDSIDQGVTGIPVTSILQAGSKVSFDVGRIKGSFEGNIDQTGTEIAGNWRQGGSLPLKFSRGHAAMTVQEKPVPTYDIDGNWATTLDAGAVVLRLVFHMAHIEGGLTVTLDSPDQGVVGIRASAVLYQDSALTIELDQIDGVFTGKANKNFSAIAGTWKQGGRSFPLVLKRLKDGVGLERRRPQNPARPYPYNEEDVFYKDKLHHDLIGATLTIPRGKAPFPAVLLIPGSGSQDRDETVMGHKPFLVMADYLTRRGIMVLRADDRGVGQSSKNPATAGMDEFAADAEAGLTYLKTRPEVDQSSIGLVGHSAGGSVASIVAARDPHVAFVILLAAPGVRGEQNLVEQVRLISLASGNTQAGAEKDANEEREILNLVKDQGRDVREELQKKLASKLPVGQLKAQIAAITSPWFRQYISYDPAVSLKKIRCPVLALSGEKDLQVPPRLNLPAIRKALDESGKIHFEVDELASLNHLFQTARTGLPTEYASIEETMSPAALQKIGDWILKQK